MINVIEYMAVPPFPSSRFMPTTYSPIGIVLFSSSCNSEISSFFSVSLNARKEDAESGMLTEIVTAPFVTKLVAAGRVYDQAVDTFVLTMV